MARKLQDLTKWTDAQLQLGWERGFEDRVKTGLYKGCVTERSARLGDAILAEAKKRGVQVTTPIKYQ